MKPLANHEDGLRQTEIPNIISQPSNAKILADSLESNLGLTNVRDVVRIIKQADKTIYSQARMPRLKSDEAWINGGQTKEWYNNAVVKPKQIFFFDNGSSILPWIKVSVKDAKKLTNDPNVFSIALFNMVEQLKNNISAAKMAKQFAAYDQVNAELHKKTYINRKKDAEKMLFVLERTLKEKRRFIGQNANLFAVNIARIDSYKAKMTDL